MYTRLLSPPRGAFFLFGPRGTGKSTWIASHLENPLAFNLLETDTMLRLERNPAEFRAEVGSQPRGRWIVVDEVQRVPKLLDEVHLLMERGHRKFALTGSSARKLRRGAANLLAGRAIVKKLFPLTTAEMEFSVPPRQLLRYGAMPLSVNADDDQQREDFLRAYVSTYLTEEIKAEALVRDLGGFSRFVEVAALMAGQTTNISGVARDAGVSRDSARGYFDVLVDTLVGTWLPAYRPRTKVKEVALPKFYWFDPGVLHAAAGGFDQPLPSDWDGILLEHLVHHEIQSHVHYRNVKGSLGYWRTPTGTEVDFVWWYGRNVVAIEVKNAREFRRDFTKGIESFRAGANAKGYVVYRGNRELEVGGTRVLPIEIFLRRLHAGEIL